MNFHAGNVAIQNLFGEQLPFLRFSAWIADGTGRAAGHGNGLMAQQLKSSQRQQRHKISDDAKLNPPSDQSTGKA